VPADTAFQIHFVNNDNGIPHNVAIHDQADTEVFQGEIFPGVAERTYDVPPLAAGEYRFICTVHPNMAGSLTAE
jgi:plastocyanin